MGRLESSNTIMSAKCPSCGKVVSEARLIGLPSKGGYGKSGWNAVAHTCPWCSAIFSVEIDPIAVRSDLEARIEKLESHIDDVTMRAANAVIDNIAVLERRIRGLGR